MPVFNLTPTQRRTLRALDWLYEATNRRQGRSTVLALSYLRRLTVHPSLSRDGWLDVSDHVSGSRQVDRMFIELIAHLGARIGLDIDISPQSRIRLRDARQVTQAVREALTDFGDLPYSALDAGLAEIRANAVGRRSMGLATPATTIWDHLMEGDG